MVGEPKHSCYAHLDFRNVRVARIVLMASGAGTLAQAVLDAVDDSFSVVALVTDQPEAAVVQRALAAGVPVHIVPVSDYASRPQWNQRIAAVLATTEPDLIVSAGFMRILGAAVVDKFGGRIINSHPSLLPAFPGAHAVADALAAGASETGATVHLVDHGMDTGLVLAQVRVPVEPGDTIETLHERIKVVERELIVDVIRSRIATEPTGASHE